MNFKEANEKLKKMVPGKYIRVRYDLTTHERGGEFQECQLYVDPGLMTTEATWELAFHKMAAELGTMDSTEGIEDIEELGVKDAD